MRRNCVAFGVLLLSIVHPMLGRAVAATITCGGSQADFDGDGRTDLAVGVRGEEVGSVRNAGAVSVIYGDTGGLSEGGDQLFHQDVANINGAAGDTDNFGAALAAGDFDGDGFGDLAVGVPDETVGSIEQAGAVNVIYGTINGLSSAGDQIFHQDTPGIAGAAEISDAFGVSLAVCDFDGDGFDDLAVGVLGEAIGSLDAAGMVHVIFGSSSGLTTAGDQAFHQDTPGIAGSAEAFDVFGAVLAAGDFDGDDRADLAVGAPFETVGDVQRSGGVNVIFGSSGGLTASGDLFVSQDTSGVADVAEPFDEWGMALIAGDFDGDGRSDLAVGARSEDIGAVRDAGGVNVLYGSGTGPSSSGDDFWSQDVAGVADSAEEDDGFGWRLAAGDGDGDGVDDLAITARNEGVASIPLAGAAHVLYGDSDGLSSAADDFWHQDVAGVNDSAEAGDLFGEAVTFGDFSGDGRGDMAVGVTLEDASSSVPDAGAVAVLYGTASGLASTGDDLWHQDVTGIQGAAATGDGYGQALVDSPFG